MGIDTLPPDIVPSIETSVTPDLQTVGTPDLTLVAGNHTGFVVLPPVEITTEGPMYGRDYANLPVKIIVGSSQYHIHPKLLSDQSAFWADKIQSAVGSEIHLPDVTPDVFSVFLEWLYTGELPHSTAYDLPSVFKGPGILGTEVDGSTTMSMNICAAGNPDFARLSPEELRFTETTGAQGEAYRRHLGIAENIPLTFEPTLFSYKGQSLRAVENMKQHYGLDFPLRLGCTSAKDAVTEHLLLLLLDLTILAQAWGMTRLHDQAINRYRATERVQGRYRPLSHHIDLVYERSAPDAPLRQLLSDFTQVTARRCKTRTELFPVLTRHPDFLMDFLKRADDPSLVYSKTPMLLDKRCDAYMLEYREMHGEI